MEQNGEPQMAATRSAEREPPQGTLATVLSVPLLPFLLAWDFARLVVSRGLPFLGRVLARPFRLLWRALTAIATALAWPLRLLWRALTAIATALAGPFRLLWRALTAIGKPLAALLHTIGSALAWPLRLGWDLVRAAARVARRASAVIYRVLVALLSACGRVVGRPLRVVWRGLCAGASWLGGALWWLFGPTVRALARAVAAGRTMLRAVLASLGESMRRMRASVRQTIGRHRAR
jgi:hypothetical protein